MMWEAHTLFHGAQAQGSACHRLFIGIHTGGG